MLREFFRLSRNDNLMARQQIQPILKAEHENSLAKLAEEFDRSETVAKLPASGMTTVRVNTTPSFEQIYQNAAVKPPRLNYSILKVSEMLNSSHLSTMSDEAKRCSLLDPSCLLAPAESAI